VNDTISIRSIMEKLIEMEKRKLLREYEIINKGFKHGRLVGTIKICEPQKFEIK